MSGSYRECVKCGKRALKFATRCPGCGIELANPAPFEDAGGRELTWLHALKGLMTVLAIGGVLAYFGRASASPATLSAETSINTTARRERHATVGASPAAQPRLSTRTVAAPATPSARLLLIAKGWTHVRSRPAANAKLEAMLTPGDTVMADSLAKGWYRVALYGDVLGYAKESTLAPAQH